jgi:hypothetical protein
MTLKSVYYLDYKDCNHIATENKKGTIQISLLNPQFIDLYIQFRNKAINAISESVKPLKPSEVENQSNSSLYFESFIYNWISFNSIYEFYRDRSKIKDFELSKIRQVFESSEANKKFIIKNVYLMVDNDDFSTLIEKRFFSYETRNSNKNNDNEMVFKDDIQLYELFLDNQRLLNQLNRGINNPSSDAQNVFKFFTWRLYRIRNFLFHGKKSFMNERDSLIVKSGAKLLNYFLNVFELEFLKNIRIKD